MNFTDDQIQRMANRLTLAEHGYSVTFDDFNDEEKEIALDDAREALAYIFKEDAQ